MNKLCIGIPSWLPDDTEARALRMDRVNRLVKQIKELFDLPIIFVAQNWKDYSPKYDKMVVVKRDKLGILNARKLLFETFLQSEFTHILMFDDDAIIQGNKELCDLYVSDLLKRDKVFSFVKNSNHVSKYTEYADSQLNLACISKELYQQAPIPNVDPQKSQGFEDRIWSTLLHLCFGEFEYDVPKGLYCTHFKNPNEKAPSTWSKGGHDWNRLRLKTHQIEHYIYLHKKLPREVDRF